MKRQYKTKPPGERFAGYVNFNGPTKPAMESECWEWTGTRLKTGYGMMGIDGKLQYAHRFAMMHSGVELRDGDCVCHRCDNPACVRVDHLFVGTRADNNADKMKKGRYRGGSGENHGLAKLTRESVLHARNMSRGGIGSRRIAKQLGVARSTIQQAISGETWKCVS